MLAALLVGHTLANNASCTLPGGAQPIWSSNNSQYALLRKEFKLSSSSNVYSACIAITASQCNDKLLASYKLWFNGVALTNGPGRNMNATQGYDAVHLVPALLNATNVIAIQAYHNGNNPSSSAKVLVNFAATFVDGSSQVVPSDVTWSGLGADDVFNPYHGCVGGMYCAPKEYLDARTYPAGWQLPDFELNKAQAVWPAAVNHTAFALPLVPKLALPIVQYEMPAAKITEITSSQCLIARDNTHDLAVLSCNGTDIIIEVGLMSIFGDDLYLFLTICFPLAICSLLLVLQRNTGGVRLVRPSHRHLHRANLLCCYLHGTIIQRQQHHP
jgi:hypothetical protein